MELVTNKNFETLDINELENIDGGLVLLGVTISGVLAAKIAAGGFGAGVTVAGIYYSQKK